MDQLQEHYPITKTRVRRLDGAAIPSYAPPYVAHPIDVPVTSDLLQNPVIMITDYGNAFFAGEERGPNPDLYTISLHSPPEAVLNLLPTCGWDIWMLGVTLFRIFAPVPLFGPKVVLDHDLLDAMTETFDEPEQYWAGKLTSFKRRKYTRHVNDPDGSRLRANEYLSCHMDRRYIPMKGLLKERMKAMVSDKLGEDFLIDVAGGEQQALKSLFCDMMKFPPRQRPKIEQVMGSKYMMNWAFPAWERQRQRVVESVAKWRWLRELE